MGVVLVVVGILLAGFVCWCCLAVSSRAEKAEQRLHREKENP